jgi:hypothetical protein
LAKCLVRPGKIDGNGLTAVIEEKRSYIRSKGILEFIPLQSGLESVGGLSNLKQAVHSQMLFFYYPQMLAIHRWAQLRESRHNLAVGTYFTQPVLPS